MRNIFPSLCAYELEKMQYGNDSFFISLARKICALVKKNELNTNYEK